MAETLSPDIVEDLRHGRAPRERKLAVCTGGAHLAPADRAEILTVLAHDADEMVANRAQDALLSQPIESLVEAVPREAEPDLGKRQTLLERLGNMSVAQRVQFAFKGGSEARRTLIRDSNKVVQRAVLQSPRLTDQEVEAFASMSNLTDEILRAIAKNRNFRKNYVVVRNLMNNPKTPLDVKGASMRVLEISSPRRSGASLSLTKLALAGAMALAMTAPSALGQVPQRSGADPWSAAQLIDPADFARELAAAKADSRPTVVSVGFRTLFEGGHVPGATFHGTASTEAGLASLRA